MQPQRNKTTSWQKTFGLNVFFFFLATSRAASPPRVQQDAPETVQNELSYHLRDYKMHCSDQKYFLHTGGVKTHPTYLEITRYCLRGTGNQAPRLE